MWLRWPADGRAKDERGPPSLELDQTWDAFVDVGILGFEAWNLPRWEWGGGPPPTQGRETGVRSEPLLAACLVVFLGPWNPQGLSLCPGLGTCY